MMPSTASASAPAPAAAGSLHAAVAHDQELAVDGAWQPQPPDQVGEAAGNILAGAGIEPRDRGPVLRHAGHGLHADAVPFPFAQEFRRIEAGKIAVLDRVG